MSFIPSSSALRAPAILEKNGGTSRDSMDGDVLGKI